MGFHGPDGEDQPAGDLGIGEIVDQQPGDVYLLLGQPGQVAAGG